jgi:DNA-binding NtrC family response regulator
MNLVRLGTTGTLHPPPEGFNVKIARENSLFLLHQSAILPAQMSKLLLIDDEEDVRYSFQRIFDSPEIEFATASSGEEGLKVIPKFKPDLVLMDVRMGGMNGLETLRRIRATNPKLLVILMTAYGTTQTAIEAMKLGAYDYLLKPFDAVKIKELVGNALKAARDMKQVVSYEPLLESADYELGIVGRSELMQQVFKLIGQVAASDATALVTGESGTGKELVARAIHFRGAFANRPFVAVDCGSLVPTLIESELFGYEKGAFTGALKSKQGLFQSADTGSVFLDEIGELPLELQAKLLRVLQEKEVRPVGSNQRVKVDVRVIAATNRDLETAYKNGTFRKDLYFRLNVVTLHVPALRERRSDIPMLVNWFCERYAPGADLRVSSSAMKALMNYEWPGNVRELENCVERAVALGNGTLIDLGDLPASIAGSSPLASRPAAESAPELVSDLAASAESNASEVTASVPPSTNDLEDIERATIQRVFEQVKGDKALAGRMLGISRATLYRKLKRYNIGGSPASANPGARPSSHTLQ